MNKFFRKYNKWLLAVFGSGLMVIFLMPEIPSLVSNMGLNSAVIATVDGTSITREELIEYQEQAKIIDRMQDQGALLIPFVGQLDGWEQWYLLVREARQAGMVGGNATSPLTEDQTIQFARGFGVNPQTIQKTWVNFAGVANYLIHLNNSAPLSDRRLRRSGRRLFDTAAAQVVSIKADTPSTNITPSDDALQAHLDAWGDTEPGQGDHGFGYRLPDRVELEWISVPNDAIRASLAASDAMNDIDQLKYWRRHEGEKGIPDIGDGDLVIPEVVTTRMLDELTDTRRSEVTRRAGDHLRTPRRGFNEADGYIILPGNWDEQRLSLAALRDQLQSEYALKLPDVERTPALTPVDELRQLEGIGLASSDKFGQRPVNLSALVTEAKELNGNGLYPIQQGIAGPALTDRQNNLYFFRISETDAARPPASIDESRDVLVTDLNRLAHYQELLQDVDAVRSRSQAEGLDAIASEHDARVQAATFRLYDPRFAQIFLQNQGTMPQSPQIVPGLGTDADVVATILDRVSELDANGSLDTLAAEDRIDVIASDQNLALVIVKLNERTPLTINEFTTMTETGVLPTLILQDELGEVGSIGEAFTLEALMERNNFVQPQSNTDDADATTTPADQSATADAAGS